MQKIFTAFKYGATFTSGLLVYHFYEHKEHDKQYSEIKTEIFKNAIKDGNMYTPSVYRAYSHINKFDQFFEKLILRKNNGCQFYQVYVNRELSEIAYNGQSLSSLSEEELQKMRLNVVFTANRQLQGHFGIVHGGFTSTILDNVYGYLGTLSYGLIPCATGGLGIKFKRPLFVGSEYMLEAKVNKLEGRKIYLHSTIIDKQGRVCVESEATMIRINWDLKAWQFLFNNLRVLHTIKDKFEKNIDLNKFTQNKNLQLITIESNEKNQAINNIKNNNQ